MRISSFFKEAFQAELSKTDSKTGATKALSSQVSNDLEQAVEVSTRLEGVLVELDIPPTHAAVAVAQGLLERGFPLQKKLIWTLLPWAERGQLDEALLLLQARFPLVSNMIDLVAELKTKDLHKPLRHETKDELPSELQEVFKTPSLVGRSLWSEQMQEGETFKGLVRLLVEERFIEAILNWQNKSSVVIALPFLRKQDLYASWVRITRDRDSQHNKSSHDSNEIFQVELAVPTIHLGLIRAELRMIAGDVSITFWAQDDGLNVLESCAKSLEQELSAMGWTVKGIEVGGWDHAQSSCFTL